MISLTLAVLACVVFVLCSGTPYSPCEGSFTSRPYCNTSLPIPDRVANFISYLSFDHQVPLASFSENQYRLDDKLGQFVNGAAGIPDVNVYPYQWWSEGLHGVAYSPGITFTSTIDFVTGFPQVMGTASSFNTTLFNIIGQTISTEARAMYNYGQANLTFWAPNINIFRDPRWGRGQETPGEFDQMDPYLSSAYVANFVSGMQGTGNPETLKVSSCCKHYDAYSLEDWGGETRYDFNAIVSDQDFKDTYFPVFESCANRGNASGIMCSYNAVNGIPSCANAMLLTEELRNSWGFQGYVTSDCGAVNCVQYNHFYTNNTDATCKVVLEAGMDIECGNFMTTNLAQAVSDGAVTMDDLDTALTHLYSVQVEFRLGVFDPPLSSQFANLGPSDVNSAAHQALALDAARQNVVLLQNNNNALPLNAANIQNIAVVGPNANGTNLMLGNYNGQVEFMISVVAGVQSYVSNTNFVFGCSMAGTDTSGFAEAQEAAGSADATIIVIGLDQSQEAEMNDRDIISLPGVQDQFVTAIAAAAKGPVIVVVISGGCVDLSNVTANPNVDAIVWSCYGGQSGGQGIADVLFGAYNPAGRLTQTWYTADFINLSMFDMGMRPNPQTGNPGRGYRFFTGTPVFTFGYGLSYTTFSYQWAYSDTFSQEQIAQDLSKYSFAPSRAPTVGSIIVNVTNTGNLNGDDSVLLFLEPPNIGSGNPIQFLAGFSRINLSPGQSKLVCFGLTSMQLSLVNDEGLNVLAPGTWTARVGETTMQFTL